MLTSSSTRDLSSSAATVGPLHLPTSSFTEQRFVSRLAQVAGVMRSTARSSETLSTLQRSPVLAYPGHPGSFCFNIFFIGSSKKTDSTTIATS